MLQSLGSFSPFGGGTPSASLPHKKRRARRQQNRFAEAGGQSQRQQLGAVDSVEVDENGGLLEYDDGEGSGSEYGSGSDVEIGGTERSNSGATRPSKAGSLYGQQWCASSDSRGGGGGGGGSSWLDSAGCAAVSTCLNLALLLFLLWTHSAPRCADVWMPSAPRLTPQPLLTNADGSAMQPSLLLPASPPPPAVIAAADRPASVQMPALTTLEPLPQPPKIAPIVAPVVPTPAPVAAEPTPAPVAATPTPTPAAPVAAPAAPKSTDSSGEGTRGLPKEPTPTPAKQQAEPQSKPTPTTTTKTSKAGEDQPHAASSSQSDIDAFQRSFSVDSSHNFVWSYCPSTSFALTPEEASVDYTKSLVGAPASRPCAETPTNEQHYQLSWFGRHVAQGFQGQHRFVPPYTDCVQLPPEDYAWPRKHPVLPEGSPLGAVHWPNLRVQTRQELVEFNRGTPKNLYHFDALVYDQDALGEMELAARHIPLGDKVRLMLDIGAGGGSLGILLKRKYDITTTASAFADWPYCEYMTERGEICAMLDVMEALPFAKGSFDMIHNSWVYHGQHPDELWDFVMEWDRILRPGGYLYLRGGWSNSQVIAQRSMLSQLGYTLLYETVSSKPAAVTAKVSFGSDLPYEADWVAIYVKPIRARPASQKECDRRLDEEDNSTVQLPLTARKTPTNKGNVYASASN